MASSAVSKDIDEYKDISAVPHDTLDLEVASFDDYHIRDIVRHQPHHGWGAISNPNLEPERARPYRPDSKGLRINSTSIKVVLDNIERAPFAYFRFIYAVGFLFLLFSFVVYSTLHVLLFNPVLAVFGAIGCVLIGALVEASLIVEKRKSRLARREFRS